MRGNGMTRYPSRYSLGFERGKADRLAGKEYNPILARKQHDDYGMGYSDGYLLTPEDRGTEDQ